jgi:hypothetical protein
MKLRPPSDAVACVLALAGYFAFQVLSDHEFWNRLFLIGF